MKRLLKPFFILSFNKLYKIIKGTIYDKPAKEKSKHKNKSVQHSIWIKQGVLYAIHYNSGMIYCHNCQ